MRSLLISGLIALTACGSLDNAPLQRGVVRGSLSRASADGFVSLFGDSSTRVGLGSDGAFELANVPLGPLELLAVANDEEALRVPLQVEAGTVLELGVLTGLPGSFIELELENPQRLSLSAGVVTVDGVPYVEQTDGDGDVDVGPLPSGCYQLTVTVLGVGAVTQSACASEGEHAPVVVRLPGVDGSPGREGCLKTGCQAQLVCRSNGSCAP